MYKRKFNDLKYKIVGDQAYTEDNILIYNIFSNNVPKNATTTKVSKYFQQFGEVSNVRLVGNNKSKKCFIDFADSKVAAKVLQKRNHAFLKCNLRLQACFSYYQPDGQKIINQLTESSKNDSLTDDTTACCSSSIKLHQKSLILTLNDDCLEYICKQLTPTDGINFALTCQRFCDIFKMFSSVEYAKLTTDIFYKWTLWQIRIFLQIVGSQVKTLIIDSVIIDAHSRLKTATYIKFFASLCTNVETLVILSTDIESNLLRTLFENMQQLKELDLIDINDYMLKVIKSLKNLKSLSITTNSDITGKNIHLLCGLEKLCLFECYNINPWYFRKICKNLKNLQYLDIRCCDQLEEEDFKHISENLLELKTLKLSTTHEKFNCLAQLPKLKHLEIYVYNGYSVTEEFLKNLSKYKAEQLEELKLVNTNLIHFDIASLLAALKKLKVLHCDNDTLNDEGLQKISQLTDLEEVNFVNSKGISDNGILELLKHCLKLRNLNLTKCNSISPNFISNVIKLLKEQRERWLRTVHLNLVLSETFPLKSKINEISLEDYSDVLKITLDKILYTTLDIGESDDEFFDDDDDFLYNNPFDYDYYSEDYSDDDGYGYEAMFLDDILRGNFFN